MTLKQQILHRYKLLLQDQIDIFRDMISNLTQDAQNDAKSSAGDKHEIGLSMMHLEQEKLNHKLGMIMDQKAIIDKIESSTIHTQVALGSLIQANSLFLFMSVALPKINIENKTIIAISPQSPLGSKLLGKKEGFEFEINSTKYRILSVQ